MTHTYIRTHLSPPGDVIAVFETVLPDNDPVALLLDIPHIAAIQVRDTRSNTYSYVKATA